MTRFTVCVGVDGVIFDHDGWKGLDHVGKLKTKAIEGLQILKKAGCKIVIHSTRLNYQKQKEEPGYLVMKLKAILDLHNIPYDELSVEPGKPFADIYLDDRAVRFENWNQAITEIIAIWTKEQNEWKRK